MIYICDEQFSSGSSEKQLFTVATEGSRRSMPINLEQMWEKCTSGLFQMSAGPESWCWIPAQVLERLKRHVCSCRKPMCLINMRTVLLVFPVTSASLMEVHRAASEY